MKKPTKKQKQKLAWMNAVLKSYNPEGEPGLSPTTHFTCPNFGDVSEEARTWYSELTYSLIASPFSSVLSLEDFLLSPSDDRSSIEFRFQWLLLLRLLVRDNVV